jgi:hypothetical protein
LERIDSKKKANKFNSKILTKNSIMSLHHTCQDFLVNFTCWILRLKSSSIHRNSHHVVNRIQKINFKEFSAEKIILSMEIQPIITYRICIQIFAWEIYFNFKLFHFLPSFFFFLVFSKFLDFVGKILVIFNTRKL